MQEHNEQTRARQARAEGPDPLATTLLAHLGIGQSAIFAEAPEQEIVAALQQGEWPVRVAAVQALTERGASAPIEPLVAALQDVHESVRAGAVRALGGLGNRTPVEPLVARLHDPNWRVRTEAALALGKLTQQAPADPLVAMLRDEDESVRAAVVWALGKLGPRTPVRALVAALQDVAWSVREAAVLALKDAGTCAPIVPLVAALRDEDAAVRAAAGWTLETYAEQLRNERYQTMSQQVDFDEAQRSYGITGSYPLYQQGQYPPPGNYIGGLPGQPAGQGNPASPATQKRPLLIPVMSLVALVLVTLTLQETNRDADYTGLVFKLITLVVVCITIVAINFSFHFRR